MLGVALATAPSLARAASVSAGMTVSGRWNSNARTTGFTDKKVSGYTVGFSPSVRVSGGTERDARLRYSIAYSTDFVKDFTIGRPQSFDHDVDVTASYDLTRYTTVTFRDGFDLASDFLRERAETVDVADPDFVPGDVFRREQRIRNQATLGITHRFSSRFSLAVTGVYGVLLSSAKQRFDSNQRALSGNLRYQLTANDTFGVGANWSTQTFDDTDTQRGSSTTFFGFTGSWTHRFTPTLSLSLSGGPLFVRPEDRPTQAPGFQGFVARFPTAETDDSGGQRAIDVFSCPLLEGSPRIEDQRYFLQPNTCQLVDDVVVIPNPGGDVFSNGVPAVARFLDAQEASNQASSADSTTLAASVSLTQRWRFATFGLSLGRSTGSLSGLGSSTINDRVSVRLARSIDENWNTQLTGFWSRRQSTNEVLRAVDELSPFPTLDPVVPFIAQRTGKVRFVKASNAADRTAMGATAVLGRRFGDNMVGRLQLSWRDQKLANEAVATGTDFQDISVRLTFTYRFEAFRL